MKGANIKMLKNTEKTMEKLVALCKGRGFVYVGSEIYGGLAHTWDYGPLGTEPKIKVYILTKGADAAEAAANVEKYSQWVAGLRK